MYTATTDWYQHQGNWCGIANIRAIQVYDWLYYNGRAPAWDNSQEAIHNRLNSYSSPWGPEEAMSCRISVAIFVDDSGNDYIVQAFPPGSTTPVGQAGLADQEHFSVTVALVGPVSTYANDPNWNPEAGSITISGVKTTLYDRTTPDCGEVNRGATADFEQHHFTFFVTSIPTKAKVDIALFQSMLHSFIYTQP